MLLLLLLLLLVVVVVVVVAVVLLVLLVAGRSGRSGPVCLFGVAMPNRDDVCVVWRKGSAQKINTRRTLSQTK